ncbi:MAG TPA: YceI family protein [Candidatus Binatia bacterium]|nr:YceI family protein [Candidatus Binatia bacterium]
MLKYAVLLAAGAMLAAPGPHSPAPSTTSWQVDNGHSDAQLITDATTDFGKTKMDVTLGFGRVNGRMRLDQTDPSKSSVDITIYPSTSEMPAIGEDGKLRSQWLENLSNHTLVCFHAKGVTQRSDGKLQATGNLVLTRVDRNVEITPNEAYAGPVYGEAVVHRVMKQATFVFDSPSEAKKGGGEIMLGSTSLFREDFPQLVRAVVATYWPPVVEDKNCKFPDANEAYHGAECMGKMLDAPSLPEPPHAANAEDYPGPMDFNAIVANHLTISVHLHLLPHA